MLCRCAFESRFEAYEDVDLRALCALHDAYGPRKPRRAGS